MDVCILQGKMISSDMEGICNGCSLYLETCLPVVENGYLTGAECDYHYCDICSFYAECGQLKIRYQ